jgi:hypothetical protein
LDKGRNLDKERFPSNLFDLLVGALYHVKGAVDLPILIPNAKVRD